MSLRRKWSEEDKKNIRNLLENGKTYKEVGNIYNFLPGKLRNIMISEWGWKDFCYRLECEFSLEERLKRYSSKDLKHTRKFLIDNLLKSKEFQVEKGFMLKEDFIEQYYESRKFQGSPFMIMIFLYCRII